MLHDFLILEYYFGNIESAQNFEHALRKYGSEKVKQAVRAGFIQLRSHQFDLKNRHVFCSLTEAGRIEAGKELQI